jgi:hypothetical protein
MLVRRAVGMRLALIASTRRQPGVVVRVVSEPAVHVCALSIWITHS